MRLIKKNYAFTGASGTGKSTLLALIKDQGIKTIELSGRPYLPTNGDYVENSTDLINFRIQYGSTITMLHTILSNPDTPLFFSRCPIDKLAYSRVLEVAKDTRDLIEKEVREITPFIKLFYLPVEFELKDNLDTVRGNNEEIRRKTDREIQSILEEFNISFIKISGSIEERLHTIKSHL